MKIDKASLLSLLAFLSVQKALSMPLASMSRDTMPDVNRFADFPRR